METRDEDLNESDDTGIIYCLTNTINGKKYIGQALSYIMDHGKKIKHGLEGRFKDHYKAANSGKDYCPKLYFAMRKYGIQNFTKELLCICPISLLDDKESYYIDKFDTIKNGYNITFGKTFSKIPSKRKSRIQKISDTMKERWQDPDYTEKTKAANLEATQKRANEGKTRKTNKDLPPNIYKTDEGYDIRIMRYGKYKITSVEGKDLSDQEKLNLAVKKRDEILNNIKNNIDDSLVKKLDHNGNPLPKGVVLCKSRNNDAYRTIIRKKINGKDRRLEKTFGGNTLTMDEKLDLAKKDIITRQNDKDKLFNELVIQEMGNPQDES